MKGTFGGLSLSLSLALSHFLSSLSLSLSLSLSQRSGRFYAAPSPFRPPCDGCCPEIDGGEGEGAPPDVWGGEERERGKGSDHSGGAREKKKGGRKNLVQ